jgi:hypothetical protein
LDGRPWHSWRVLILPYIEQQGLYDEYDFDEPWDGPKNRILFARMPRVYQFHNRQREGQTTTNYLAVVGQDTIWPGAEKRRRSEITDGSANTILIVENRGLEIPWTEPRDLEFDSMPFEIDHPFGVSSWYKHPAVVMADGSVPRIPRESSPAALRAALTVNGRESFTMVASGWELLRDGRLRENAE